MTEIQKKIVSALQETGFTVLYRLKGDIILSRTKKGKSRRGHGSSVEYIKIDKDGNQLVY